MLSVVFSLGGIPLMLVANLGAQGARKGNGAGGKVEALALWAGLKQRCRISMFCAVAHFVS